MQYAIIELQGKQYKLALGQQVRLNGLIGEPGKTETLGAVLAVREEKDITVGTPSLKEDAVFTVVEHTKSDKIRVAKYKSKSRYRRVQGHRQAQTVLELAQVGKEKASAKPKTTKKAEKKTTTKPKKEKQTKETKASKKTEKKSS